MYNGIAQVLCTDLTFGSGSPMDEYRQYGRMFPCESQLLLHIRCKKEGQLPKLLSQRLSSSNDKFDPSSNNTTQPLV